MTGKYIFSRIIPLRIRILCIFESRTCFYFSFTELMLGIMEESYHKIPLSFDPYSRKSGEWFERCSEKESIDYFLELLLTTCPGEHRFDRDFGTGIWEMDFERIVSPSEWKSRFITYLSEAVEKYEKRLTNTVYDVHVSDVVRETNLDKNVNVRKRVDIFIHADLTGTNERCSFHYQLFMGPLSKE